MDAKDKTPKTLFRFFYFPVLT